MIQDVFLGYESRKSCIMDLDQIEKVQRSLDCKDGLWNDQYIYLKVHH